MPPVAGTRLPNSAKQKAMSAMASAATRYGRMPAAPSSLATTAGNTKMLDPIVTLMTLAASPTDPTVRGRPVAESEWLVNAAPQASKSSGDTAPQQQDG